MTRKWIITVKVLGDEGYNIFRAAEELESIWWTRSKASKNIKVNDIVYIYVGRPYSKIMYKFLCTGVCYKTNSDLISQDDMYWNMPKLHLDKNRDCFELSKIQFIDDENLSLSKLNELGLVKTRIQGSLKSDNNPELFEYLDKKFEEALKENLYNEDNMAYDLNVNSHGDVLVMDDIPRKPLKAELVNGSRKYVRDIRIGRYALLQADYKCEVDGNHKTFISRGSDKPYLESHHLIPISEQNEFEKSLDVPANIVALCSTCHNEIHYGKNSNVLIKKLHNSRKQRLKNAGIDISYDELLKLYRL